MLLLVLNAMFPNSMAVFALLIKTDFSQDRIVSFIFSLSVTASSTHATAESQTYLLSEVLIVWHQKGMGIVHKPTTWGTKVKFKAHNCLCSNQTIPKAEKEINEFSEFSDHPVTTDVYWNVSILKSIVL